jgi:hypothetical protein
MNRPKRGRNGPALDMNIHVARSSSVWLVFSSLVALGCSASGESSHLSLGNDGTGGTRGTVGGSGGGSLAIATSDAGSSRALSAHIESPRGITVTFVTLSCTNECADVMAVGNGGFPPYMFSWEDGSTSAVRRVCPTSSTDYRVSVTDTGVASTEFKRPATTVQAPLGATVIRCPDGGTSALPDASSPPSSCADPSPGVSTYCGYETSTHTHSFSLPLSTPFVAGMAYTLIIGADGFLASDSAELADETASCITGSNLAHFSFNSNTPSSLCVHPTRNATSVLLRLSDTVSLFGTPNLAVKVCGGCGGSSP